MRFRRGGLEDYCLGFSQGLKKIRGLVCRMIALVSYYVLTPSVQMRNERKMSTPISNVHKSQSS